MSVSILEALQNAYYNISVENPISMMIGKEQLYNSVALLEKGYPIETQLEDLISEYGSVDNAPDNH